MHKNQLQELAQRSCFNLPSYACVRQGPDHSPRFKASVNFNGEVFDGPGDCTTLRQAEHAAAEVALTSLSNRFRSRSLAARVLDETGVYKNLLQETAHRAGLKLPVYTVVRSGPGHQPVFSCTVEIAGMSFAGEPAKTKKQVEKNAAMAAWSALKQMPDLDWLMPQQEITEEKEPVAAAAATRLLSSFKPRDQQQHHQQQRRGTVLGSSSSSSASHNSSNWYGPQWRSQSPAPSDGFAPYSARAHQKQSSFSAQGPKILPPLPSATASQESFSSLGSRSSVNPSPISSNTCSIPVQLRNRSQLEELQKDVDDRERSDSKGKALEKDDREWVMAKLQARANQQQSSAGLIGPSPSQFSSRPFRPPLVTGRNHPAMPMPRVTGRNPPAMPMPRMMAGGGYRAPGIAPAVHIRPMIPVCAAPPARPAVNTTAHKKQPEEEISGATSKLNKLEI